MFGTVIPASEKQNKKCAAFCFSYYRHSTDREVALMILMAYFSYMLAEVSL